MTARLKVPILFKTDWLSSRNFAAANASPAEMRRFRPMAHTASKKKRRADIGQPLLRMRQQ
jgi:hypothetical protein